jgi:hypothetical protein
MIKMQYPIRLKLKPIPAFIAYAFSLNFSSHLERVKKRMKLVPLVKLLRSFVRAQFPLDPLSVSLWQSLNKFQVTLE